MSSIDKFEWLDDDVVQYILEVLDDDAEVWNLRNVSKQLKHRIGTARKYRIQPFMAHPAMLNAMCPHKRMWRAARDEFLQDALLGKLDNPAQILAHATQDIEDVLDGGPNGIRELTLYDLCVINNEDVALKMVNIDIPIIKYLIFHVRIPRVQRAELPRLPKKQSHIGIKEILTCPTKKAVKAAGPREHLFEEMLRTCAYLKQELPAAHFLKLHDKYFAFQFGIPHYSQYFDECLQATKEHPSLYNIAIRKRGIL